MSVLRTAWRNLWRNRRRTAITVAAVSLNTWILVTTYGLMDGLMGQAVRNATQMVTGEAQIHAEGYLTDRSMYKVIPDSEKALHALEELTPGAVPRTYGQGLVSRGTKSAGALFWGVDPEMEKAHFDLPGHLAQGSFLASPARKGLVLGKKLARSLGAEVGSEIVLVVQAADGSLGNDLFTVTGIFRTAGEGIDRGGAFMHVDDFRQLFVMPEGIHEIAVNTRGRIPLVKLADILARAVPGAEVKTWRQLLPALSDMIQVSDASMAIFGAIFFLAGGLGVMNTMLMATYERSRELGLLKALGASPWRIVRDVTVEAWLLALTSTFLGAVSGLAAAYLLQQVGIDTSGFAGETIIAGVAFDPVWRASVSLGIVVRPVIVMWIVCLLAALYPATMSARLDPVKSMQRI